MPEIADAQQNDLIVLLLMVVQVAYAFDSVPKAEYRQRRVKLAAMLHGGVGRDFCRARAAYGVPGLPPG